MLSLNCTQCFDRGDKIVAIQLIIQTIQWGKTHTKYFHIMHLYGAHY